jgi:hypothetical protein
MRQETRAILNPVGGWLFGYWKTVDWLRDFIDPNFEPYHDFEDAVYADFSVRLEFVKLEGPSKGEKATTFTITASAKGKALYEGGAVDEATGAETSQTISLSSIGTGAGGRPTLTYSPSEATSGTVQGDNNRFDVETKIKEGVATAVGEYNFLGKGVDLPEGGGWDVIPTEMNHEVPATWNFAVMTEDEYNNWKEDNP